MVQTASDERGTSTLEFVVVLPTLLFVLFVIVEVSRAWLTLNIATTAAREGARVGAVTPSAGGVFNDALAIARIDRILESSNLTQGAARRVTCPDPCGSDPDSQVQATVTVVFQTVIPLLEIVPWLAGPTNITGFAIMRHE